MNVYIADQQWHDLASKLVIASAHPVDPESEIQITLASFGIMPVSCRDDVPGIVLLDLDKIEGKPMSELTPEELEALRGTFSRQADAALRAMIPTDL